jgi:DNA-binding winged helix-turn-helix (wHTH) protein
MLKDRLLEENLMLKDRLLEENLNALNCCCTDISLLRIIRNLTKIGISFHEQITHKKSPQFEGRVS